MCSARIDGVQTTQSCDLMTATFIVAMIGEGGQAGGGLAFFDVKMTPLGLLKMPEKQVSPQATNGTHANNTAPLSNMFRTLRGGNRMGLLLRPDATMRGSKFWVGFYARGESGTSRFLGHKSPSE